MSQLTPESVLIKYFGYSEFRPLQKEVIEHIQAKKDCLVLMPTGGGKSICFQIPAMITDGVAIVVSPLIALMKDQVESLRSIGIPAAFINSSISYDKQQKIENAVLDGKIKLLYLAPERLLTRGFYYLMKKLKISLFAIDEAHCISAWGHDFRPEYQKLKFLKEEYPDTPIVALTATADKATRKDIAVQLNLNDPKIFLSSFDRPNISLSVQQGRNKFAKILNFLKDKQNQSGIVYCLSRKNTENIAEKLTASGYEAVAYHAGLSAKERTNIQEKFINDDVPIICATIAFGMGIDKPNIRWVIHYNLPKNIEGYYQEIGRSGRDGLKSETLLFYSFQDVMILRNIIDESSNKEIELAKLRRMQDYAEALNCRRKTLLNYFSETTVENCGNCDVCKNPPNLFDGTIIAQKALSAIKRLDEKVGMGLLIDVLRGSSRQDIFMRGYHEIKTYGAGRDIPFNAWQQFILQMLNLGLIEIAYDEKQVLKLTSESNEVLFKGKKVELVKFDDILQKAEERKAKEKPVSKRQRIRDELFERLRALRKFIAQKENVPPYIVFGDATLEEMAAERPLNNDDLLEISGVGEKKLKIYGDIFINEIVKFVKEKATEGETIQGSTYLLTKDLYDKGLNVNEIADKRGIKPTTVFSHLAYLIEKGEAVDPAKFMTKAELQQIVKAIEETGKTNELKPVFVALNEEVDYEKIRLVMSYVKQQKHQ